MLRPLPFSYKIVTSPTDPTAIRSVEVFPKEKKDADEPSQKEKLAEPLRDLAAKIQADVDAARADNSNANSQEADRQGSGADADAGIRSAEALVRALEVDSSLVSKLEALASDAGAQDEVFNTDFNPGQTPAVLPAPAVSGRHRLR